MTSPTETPTHKNRTIDQLHAITGGLYAEAWMAGHSFRVIAAVAGQRRWDTIYAALIANACITSAPAGRPPAGAQPIPDQMEKQLAFRRLTARKWCHANGHTLIDVSAGLQEKHPWAIQMVTRDLPRVFPEEPRSLSLPRLPYRPLTGDIYICPTGAQYEATSSGYPGLCGVGRDYNTALYQLIGKTVVTGRILRLRHFLGCPPE
jgi:hypothetical protein